MDLLNKVEIIKRNRQSILNSENVDFFGSVIKKIRD